MVESIINFLSQVPWWAVILIAFLVTFTENIFPPAPCDSLLIFTGTLVGIGVVNYWQLLFAATIGSTAGFIVMFLLGAKFDTYIMHSPRFKFISRDSLKKIEGWFERYGYWLIVANRFLSGTRAVISFFAGMSRLNFNKTIVLSAVSAALWNSILLWLGMKTGSNWQLVDKYIGIYGKVVFPLAIAIALFFLIRFIWKKKK